MKEKLNEFKQNLPLRTFWTLVFAFVSLFVVGLGALITHQRYQSSAEQQAILSGVKIAEFISIETAVPLLGEDWIALETFINQIENRSAVAYVNVVDSDGIIRGSSDINLIGERYTAQPNSDEAQNVNGASVSFAHGRRGETVYNIDVAILFQNLKVGSAIIGLSQDQMRGTESDGGWILFVFSILTLILLTGLLFFIISSLLRPLRELRLNMEKVSAGVYGTRMLNTGNNEITELVQTFNKMVESVQNATNTARQIVTDEAISTETASSQAASIQEDAIQTNEESPDIRVASQTDETIIQPDSDDLTVIADTSM